MEYYTAESRNDSARGKSTSSRVYETLRKAILTQKLEPGTRLVEAKVAKELGFSITPVRQAFTMLANQGLLVVFPYRGTYVTILTREYANDIVSVRKVLEPLACSLAFEHLTPADADYLNLQCEMADINIKSGDILASIDYDVRFHDFFFEKCGNALMVEVWDVLKNRIAFFQAGTKMKITSRSPLLTVRHGKIIKAVREMDRETLLSSVVEHLDVTMYNAELPSIKDVLYK